MFQRHSRRYFVRSVAGLTAGAWLLTQHRLAIAQASRPVRPLILVHGFADQVWTWQRPDNPIVARLIAAGYGWESGSLVAFSYPPLSGVADFGDSQGDINTAVVRLANLVRDLAVGSPDGQVDLLGFSMGGLVARSAVSLLRTEASSDQSRIGSLLTVATPNNGADLLMMVNRLADQPQAMLEDLTRELLGLDLDSAAAHEMMPGSDFLGQLNDAGQIDSRVRYVTLAGAAQLALRAGPLSRLVGVGDGVISSDSAAYLPGVTHRVYLLPDVLGEAETPWAALRRSQVFHPRLMFNDNVALVVAAELAAGGDRERAALGEKLAHGEIRCDERN